jgi:hypothetical protein
MGEQGQRPTPVPLLSAKGAALAPQHASGSLGGKERGKSNAPKRSHAVRSTARRIVARLVAVNKRDREESLTLYALGPPRRTQAGTEGGRFDHVSLAAAVVPGCQPSFWIAHPRGLPGRSRMSRIMRPQRSRP